MGIKDRKQLRVMEGGKSSLKLKMQELKERLKEKPSKKNLVIIAVVLLAGIAIFLFMNLRTYTGVRVIETYSVTGAADSNYKEFADGILKYTRDGVSYLNMEGEEQWNVPYQIKTPFVEANNVSAAIACKGGNQIVIFKEEGLKGEIKTNLPIEKLTISEQGIVGVILKNESSPKIICYDMAGNVLVEHQVSLAGMGYPMDIAISPDGKVLQVTYLYVHDGQLLSKVAYYNFGAEREGEGEHQVGYKEYKNTIIASGFYMDGTTSAIVGDNCMTLFKGHDNVKEVATIVFDKEVQSIGHSDKYISVVLANTGETGYEVRMYNKAGKMVTCESFTGNYRHLKVCGNEIIMYDGKECLIFRKNGVKRFEGEMNSNIQEIIPLSGMNVYVVMNANGIEDIRFAK